MLHHNELKKNYFKRLMRARINKFLLRFSAVNWNQHRKSQNPKDQLTPDESKALWSRIQNTLHSY